MILNSNIDDDFDERRSQNRDGDAGVIENKYIKGKRQKFGDHRKGNNNFKGKNGGQNNEEAKQQAYGNSYGKKGQTNNTSLITNEDLRASMWKSHGFIVDKNLTKLAKMLQQNGINCFVPPTSDSEKICAMALE